MRAARIHAPHDIRLETIPEPSPATDSKWPNRVLLSVEWCGICGSDLHEYHTASTSPGPDNPHPLTGDVKPVVMGHELCGIVKDAPSHSRFKAGDRVMVDPRLNCQSCRQCETGNDHRCPKFGFIGYSGGGGGGFSEVVGVEDRMLHKLPENVGLEYAALIEPLTVALHAVRMASLKEEKWEWSGKTVLVSGGGPVGYAVILILRAYGVGKVVVSEPTVTRREQMVKMADLVVDPVKENVAERCGEVTSGEGVDVVFDCAGVARALRAGMEAIRHGGTYINVALWKETIPIPMWPYMGKEVTFRPSMCFTESDMDAVIDLMGSGKLKGYENMVSSRISLEDVVSKGFDELLNNSDHHIKILVTPKPSNLS